MSVKEYGIVVRCKVISINPYEVNTHQFKMFNIKVK